MTTDSGLQPVVSGREEVFSAADAQQDSSHADLGNLVSEALLRNPDRTALRHCGRTLTRRELRHESMRVAELLGAADVARHELVLVEIAHSPELVAALCGVLMAGGTPVPLDPTVSEERRQAIREDVNARVVLSISEDQAHTVIDRHSRPAQLVPGTAFLVYTSGSSGRPKGVEIPHHGYVRRLQHIVEASSPESFDVDLIWTPSSFIGFLDEVFYPLLLGVPAAIASATERGEPHAFADLIAREGVTAFRITPSLLEVFLTLSTAERLRTVRSIYCSGEAISPTVQAKVHSLLDATLIGFYGASEAPGIGIHVFDQDEPPLSATVFSPQAFSEVRIVDEHGDLASPGELGEIWVSGCAVAGGYRGKPALTAEKFVQCDGMRWYRTGDRGRHFDDGRVEVLGRLDNSEVKINGIRIGLGDVRTALQSLADVHDAWVTPVEVAEHRDPVLVGHCVGEGELPDASAARRALASQLPSAALPRYLIRHDCFPLTDNGKLDLQALAHAARDVATAQTNSSSHGSGAALRKPQSALIRTVGRLWCDTLFIDEIGEHEDFFDLGGDSLRTIRLLMEVEEVFDVDLPDDCVFGSASTISGMASTIEESRRNRKAFTISRETLSPQQLAKKSYWAMRKKTRNFIKTLPNLFSADKSCTNENDIALDEIRRRMGLLTNGWPGENVGVDFPLYQCGSSTGRIPLFYCVNFKTQAEKLSDVLDRDVNLFAMRSLNGIISDWSIKRSFVPSVINIYKNEIARIAPTGPLAIAGNCQGGVIAEAVARLLLGEGRDVVQLALLEHEPSAPYPGRVSMFFHAESLDHNPFHQRPDPVSEWREMHSDVTWDLLPDGHGRTFNNANFPLFSKLLVGRIQQACAPHSLGSE